MVSIEDTQAFESDGFIVIKNFFPSAIVEDVKTEIDRVGKFIVGDRFEFDTYDPSLMTPAKQSKLYDRLHYLPSLGRLSGNLKLLDFCQSLGLQLPVLMGCCNMRYDRPNDSKHLFDWHQDSLYLLGSVNAVTAWIPFGQVDEHHGTIQVIPGSHKNGIFPYKKISDKPVMEHIQFLQRDLTIDGTVTGDAITILAGSGDLILFKQMLLHRSLPNFSEFVRWTAQVRISDLAYPGFLEAGCPTGDKKNIFFQEYPGFRHPLSNSCEN